MRMWNVPPEIMCKKHLLGEHVEMHMFAGTLRKGISIKGYITKGLVDLRLIQSRHDALAEEITIRGMNHKSPLSMSNILISNPRQIWGKINIVDNVKELHRRCSDCRQRIENLTHSGTFIV